MTSNLRAGFQERQRKCLFESIVVNHSSSKRACMVLACPEPISALALVLTLLTIAAEITPEPDEKLLSADDIAHHELRRPSIGPDHFSEESFEHMISSLSRPKPSYVPSREEIAEFLRQIPSFIERETLVQKMGVLFSATQRILIEIDNDPNQSFMARLPYSTPGTAISRIMPMHDYTAFKMA